jgi:Xaa-Pro aminopeptidase
MGDRGLDALLVTTPPNVRYLTGFSGSHGLCLITPRQAVFVTDPRYQIQSRGEVRPPFRRLITRGGLLETVARAGLLPRGSQVGFESGHVSVAQHRNLRRLLPGRTLRPLAELVENLTALKDAREVRCIAKAAAISDGVFSQIVAEIRPGMREREIAARISYLQRCAGSDGDAFDPIVASGERAALPHARASARKLRRGDLVILDFGCTVDGYCSDLTRTVAIGRASRRAREVHRAVRDAQAAAIEGARDGVRAAELDRLARARIEEAGFGAGFNHSLGHGLGLSLHARPRVSSLSKERLRQGMVLTIEPGVYIPGWGGVRIEDDVLIRAGACRVLTASPRELLVL